MKFIYYIEKYPVAALTLFVLTALLVHLDIPNVTIMEARNFITSREMISDNNWLLTTMNGEPRYQKPPLPTWLTAISMIIFGVNSLFALRLPAAIMVLVLALFTYKLGKRTGLQTDLAVQISFILATSFYIIGIINEAPWDIFTHGFMMGAIYYLYRLFREQENLWKNALFSGFLIGLSIMSKGPISLYALFIPFILSFGLVYKFKSFKTKWKYIIVTVLISIAVGGWWFIYVRLTDPESFIAIASKETANWSSYNVKPFYYYWSFFTQSGIWAIPAFIGLLYPYIVKRVEHPKVYKFTFWWTIFALLLLSVIPEKKARYLVPVLIPLAFNTGFYIKYLIDDFINIKSFKELIPVYFNFCLVALICISLPLGLYLFIDNVTSEYLLYYLLLSIASVFIGILILINLFKRNIKQTFYYVVAFIGVVLIFGLPISLGLRNNEAFNSIASLHKIEDNNQITTYSFGELTPELLWDYNGKIKNIYIDEKLEFPQEDKFGILVMERDFEKIEGLLIPQYNLERITEFDLNVGKKQKDRLKRDFFLISKK